MTDTVRENVVALCQKLYDKKAVDIIALDVADRTIIADCFVVCSGRAVPQVQSLADEALLFGRERPVSVLRTEGYAEGRWIVIDFGDILLHIFHPEERTYYNIERLWQDDENVTDYSKLFSEELGS